MVDAPLGKGDLIGRRGEAIAYTCLTRVCRKSNLPYFLPHYLGEKSPTFDFLVELVGAGKRTPFFFVQVKSTRKRITTMQRRLQVKVPVKEVRRMAAYPAPTYVVGVHEVEERAFVVSVHEGMTGSISSLTTAHELDCATLRRLWQEVRDFWKDRPRLQSSSSFTN